jgi:predicted dehydrogenase
VGFGTGKLPTLSVGRDRSGALRADRSDGFLPTLISNRMKNTRRRFLYQSAAVVAGATLFPPDIIAARKGRVSALDQLRVGLVGCKGMGWSNLQQHLRIKQVTCAALADVDQSVLDGRAANVEELQGSRPALYRDYRRMLEREDLDYVIIATPDHWHCLPFCDALSAGLHVYQEKPLANSIEECNLMRKAARRYGRMVQIGQWQRSGSHYENAIEYLRSGQLGNVRLVKCWAYQGWMKPVTVVPDSVPPAGVDYDMWLGPAPRRPFNQNRFHFNFRWFWDYAGGLMTDWGVHEIDIALHAMGVSAPKSVMASGGKLAYPDDASETPDTLQAVFEYDGFNMLWEHGTGIDLGNYGRTEGIAFIGNNGTLVLNRDGWDVIPETQRDGNGVLRYKVEDIPEQRRPSGENYLYEHVRNFVDAITGNRPEILKCGIETGAVAAINAHMGNVAYKTGRKVYWDAAAGNFGTDEAANRLIRAEYHNGWSLPSL